jgi:hypothetical protein
VLEKFTPWMKPTCISPWKTRTTCGWVRRECGLAPETSRKTGPTRNTAVDSGRNQEV